jgi:hypothetical protein
MVVGLIVESSMLQKSSRSDSEFQKVLRVRTTNTDKERRQLLAPFDLGPQIFSGTFFFSSSQKINSFIFPMQPKIT